MNDTSYQGRLHKLTVENQTLKDELRQCVEAQQKQNNDDEKLKKDIIKTKGLYDGQSYKFSVMHHLTRRLESVASLMFMFGLLTFVGSKDLIPTIKLFSDKFSVLNVKEPPAVYLFEIGMFAIIFIFALLAYSVEKIDKNDLVDIKKSKSESVISLIDNVIRITCCWLFFSLLIFNWVALASHTLIWGIMVFVAAYSNNRKYGYTRAWSRNRYYGLQAKILLKELENNLDENPHIRQKMYALWKEATEQSHKDTVGDYIEHGNSALKFFSSKKIK